MKCVFALLSFVVSTEALAEDLSSERVEIEIVDVMSGVSERSVIALKCTRVASAAVFLHSQGQLSSVMNQVARIKEVGSSDDAFTNSFIEQNRLDPNDEFLFPALFLAQMNITWLETKGTYRSEMEPIYTAYLAASCARVAKIPGGA